MQHYLSASIQFSRGCPFRCEFCDIIVTFGRRPRLKRTEQVIDELEALRTRGVRSVFIVDDNLIGNKREIKKVLRKVIEYQKNHRYPFRLFTETSLDLAEDDELMELMVEANITRVFIGIESPNEASLKETKKLQNIGKKATLIERVHRIQDAGLEVSAGMIMGFDSDSSNVFESHINFIREARIIKAMAGMLYAIPKTPLYARLAADCRIDEDDLSEYGTNVIPLRLSRDELRDGYIRVMLALYDPNAFFDRVESLFLRREVQFGRSAQFLRRSAPFAWVGRGLLNGVVAINRLTRLLISVPDKTLARFYLSKILRFAIARPDPNLILYIVTTCAFHYHAHTLAKNLGEHSDSLVSTI